MVVDVMENITLSEEQMKFYHDNGYLVLKKLIDFGTLYSCKQRFIQIAKGIVEPPGNMIIMKEVSLLGKGLKGEQLINKLQEIQYDDVLSTYIEHPALTSVVSQVTSSAQLTAAHSMLINKPPGTTRHPPHQDMYYFPFRPAERVAAAWTAIDDVTIQNGCLYVIPGSHKAGQIYPHDYASEDGVINKMYHGIVKEQELAPEHKRVHLEMSPGDTVLFHPLLIHGSGPNVTQRYRKAISCHYMWSHCAFVDVKGSPQEKIAKEVEDIIKKKGATLSYEEFWKLKSKPIIPKSQL